MRVRQEATLPLMFGLPDDHMVRLVSVANGGRIDVPGAASFLPFLRQDHISRFESVFFGPGIGVKPSPGMMGQPIVNNTVDPDIAAASLRILAAMVKEMGSPCFNHPEAILDTGRDRVAQKLAAIDGLHVPKTVRVRIDEPSDIPTVMDANELRFPILVRVTGTHGGLALVRVDGKEQLKAALRGIPWGGRELYISQFVEYSDPVNLYRKMRIVVVGEEIFLRHAIATPDWQVHSQARSDSALREESELLATFEEAILPAIRNRVTDVVNELDLDYFGIDCSFLPDGRLLVFEANAAMNILLNPYPSPNCWDRPVRRIHDALSGLLFNPSRWRYQGAVA